MKIYPELRCTRSIQNTLDLKDVVQRKKPTSLVIRSINYMLEKQYFR